MPPLEQTLETSKPFLQNLNEYYLNRRNVSRVLSYVKRRQLTDYQIRKFQSHSADRTKAKGATVIRHSIASTDFKVLGVVFCPNITRIASGN